MVSFFGLVSTGQGGTDSSLAGDLMQPCMVFWLFFSFYVRYSTLLYQTPLRFHCVGGCWDQTQDCCDFGIDSQTL